MGQSLDREAEGASKSEVSYFEGTSPINEKVLGFEVSVYNTTGVAVVDAIAELVEEQFDLVLTHGGLVLAQPLFEVVIDQLKDKI